MPVVLAKKYPGVLTQIDREIHDRLSKGENESFLYVVPTKRKVRELQRELLHRMPKKASPAFYLYTLETLATELCTAVCSPSQYLSAPTQAVLVHKAIEQTKENLQYFSRDGRPVPRGTLQRIIGVINALKESGVYPALLHEELTSADEHELRKLHDILAIYEKYDELLDEKFADLGGMYKDLNRTWQEEEGERAFRVRFEHVNTIFVAGFDEFSDPEITMLNHLSKIDGVSMVISFDYRTGNDELFGHLRENYEKFLALGFQKLPPTKQKTNTAERRAAFRDYVAERLFQRESAEPLDVRERVTLFTANDRRDEAIMIAKIIKQMALEKPGRDLSKICVAMYLPQNYTKLFREVFAHFGIPANITDRYSLDQSPVVVAILSLLQVWQNDFRQRDVMRALSSPYFDFASDGYAIDAGNLYKISSRLKISVGKEWWKKRIDERLVYVVREMKIAEDDFEEENLRRENRDLQKARHNIEKLERLLAKFEGNLTPLEFRSHLMEIIDELGVRRKILKAHGILSDEQIEVDIRAFEKFVSLLDEFIGILSFERSLGVTRSGESAAAPLRFYLEELRIAVSQVRYNIRQKYGYGVYVTSLGETRGLDFDVMFVPGLVDGEFPPLYEPDIFLSSDRQHRKRRYHLTEHRYLFYQGVTNYSEHLYLSYPRREGDVEIVPSSFVESFLKVVNCEDWRTGVPTSLLDPVYSENELLERFGGQVRRVLIEKMPHPRIEGISPSLAMVCEHVQFAIEVEQSRMSTHDLPEYEGKIFGKLHAAERKKLAHIGDRVFSVSHLESYGACPFQYFVSRVLRLDTPEDLETGLSAMERGGVVHEILFEFYVKRREQKVPPLFECSDSEYQKAVEDLLQLAKSKLDDLYVPDPLWQIEREELLGGQNGPGALREFMEVERNRKLAVKPAYFEVAFGPRAGSKRSTDPELRWDEPITAGTVKMRGRIDRLDIGGDIFTIIDYKTGSHQPGMKDILAGTSLQLPLYLYAVERILAKSAGKAPHPVAGVYYNILKGSQKIALGSTEHKGKAFTAVRGGSGLLESDAALREVIEKAITYVNKYVQDILLGEFPLTSPQKAKEVCPKCDYRRICRVSNDLVTMEFAIEHATTESTP